MMDLLFREYASPFSLIDVVIASGRFTEWIDQFLEGHKEKVQWEHWLHKIFEQTWTDYLEESKNQEEIHKNLMSASWDKSDIETTIKDSYNMMHNFIPEQKGGTE